MMRNYTWRLDGKRWQKVVRVPADMYSTSFTMTSESTDVVVEWEFRERGPLVR